MNYGQDLNIGKPLPETVNVIVNAEVINKLTEAVDNLDALIEEQRKTQRALEFIEGEELDLD